MANMVQEVQAVLQKIEIFTKGVHSLVFVVQQEKFKNVLVVGIGGSYLGQIFTHACIVFTNRFRITTFIKH